MLIASARTWTATELAPALSSSNSASGAHSAVANVLLTPLRPPQVTELISVRRTGKPARLAALTAHRIVLAIPAVALSLSTRAIVGNVLVLGREQADSGYRWTVIARRPGCGPASRWEIQLRWAAGSASAGASSGTPRSIARISCLAYSR